MDFPLWMEHDSFGWKIHTHWDMLCIAIGLTFGAKIIRLESNKQAHFEWKKKETNEMKSGKIFRWDKLKEKRTKIDNVLACCVYFEWCANEMHWKMWDDMLTAARFVPRVQKLLWNAQKDIFNHFFFVLCWYTNIANFPVLRVFHFLFDSVIWKCALSARLVRTLCSRWGDTHRNECVFFNRKKNGARVRLHTQTVLYTVPNG